MARGSFAPTVAACAHGLRAFAIWGCVAWACAAGPASAQVTRCTDPATGRVAYTDGSCASGASGRVVQPRQSPAEIAQEREQAAAARAQWSERVQQDERIRSSAAAAAAAATPPAPPDPATSPACLDMRRQLQQALDGATSGLYDDQVRLDAAQRQADMACLTPAQLARAWRPRAPAPLPAQAPVIVLPPRDARPRPAPPPAQQRPPFTHCNVFRCYDRQGNVYPQ